MGGKRQKQQLMSSHFVQTNIETSIVVFKFFGITSVRESHLPFCWRHKGGEENFSLQLPLPSCSLPASPTSTCLSVCLSVRQPVCCLPPCLSVPLLTRPYVVLYTRWNHCTDLYSLVFKLSYFTN